MTQKGSQKHSKSYVSPVLAQRFAKPFDNTNWLFETKWDGFRAIAELNHQEVDLYSRNFQSFNLKFAPVVKALQAMTVEAIFDGEVVVFENGRSRFQSLQNFQTTGQGDIRYCIFDLLFWKGENWRQKPLLKRKKKLERILAKAPATLYYSDPIIGQGQALFHEVEKAPGEGIMAKEIHSPYTSTRNAAWLKIKTSQRQEAFICGFTCPKGTRKGFGALLLGQYEKGKIRYIGQVGTGFTEATIDSLMKRFPSLITFHSPFSTRPQTKRPPTWLKPQLLCEVHFAEWTEEHLMRQASFKGLRSDKKVEEITEESTFTHLDKVYWPKEGWTKRGLLDYYHTTPPLILPYLKDRPESLHRFPNGIAEEGFYQKNIGKGLSNWLTTEVVTHKEGEHRYRLIQDEKTLLYTANLGAIDFNPFNSRIGHLEKPDYLIFDLDPEAISFIAFVETVLAFHAELEALSIPHFCKTSGATGLHIYVPMGAKYTYEQTKDLALLISHKIHAKLPSITSLERSPKNRQKRVYLDCLQNNFGQTLAAPYSVRPCPGAPVSTPLKWSEVKRGLDPLDFNISNTLQRVKKMGDLFAPVLGKGINLSTLLKKLT